MVLEQDGSHSSKTAPTARTPSLGRAAADPATLVRPDARASGSQRIHGRSTSYMLTMLIGWPTASDRKDTWNLAFP